MLQYRFNNNKSNRHIKINIYYLIVYIIVYAVVFFSYAFVCSYFNLFLVIFMTVVPFFSIIIFNVLLKKLEFKLSISDNNINRENTIHVGLLLDNKSIFTILDIKVYMNISNEFYKTKAPIMVNIPVLMRTLNKTIIPFNATLNGIVNINVYKIEIRDLMGLVVYTYEMDMNTEVMVYPNSKMTDDIDKTGLYEGVSENEEVNSKGNDLSDVSNIREYIPGDRIKDIHWKLSAKKDILLVKERVRVSERQLIMLVNTSGDNKDIDNVLEYAYNVVKMCLVDGIPTKLVWWDDKNKSLENSQVMSYEDLKQAYGNIYRVGRINDISEAKEYMKSIYNNVSSYIQILSEDGIVKGVPIDNV